MTGMELEESTNATPKAAVEQGVTESRAGWLLRPITALVRALSLLNPALVLELLSRAIDHVAAVVHPRADRRRKLVAWLRDTLPDARSRDVQNLSSIWLDGSLLCALVHTVVPGCSPTRSIEPYTSFQHGQLLVCKYLGVPPAFSEEDTRVQTLSTSLERRLVRYLSAVRQAAVPLLSASTPCPQEVKPPAPLAVARGMGLLMAIQGRRAVFYLYPLDRESSDHFVVEINGPSNDFGSAYIPAPATATRDRQRRRASFILKPWFSTTRIANVPIDWKVNPGSICVSYMPQSAGKHELCVTRRGCHLPGSPFVVAVDRSSARPDSKDDNLWLSEEEIEKRNEYKKRLKVVLRIVDFVTEKMVLTDDGRLTKLTGDNPMGTRTLSMPNLFSRLHEMSKNENIKDKFLTHDDIKLRDKAGSQELPPDSDYLLKTHEIHNSQTFRPESEVSKEETIEGNNKFPESPLVITNTKNHQQVQPTKYSQKAKIKAWEEHRKDILPTGASSWPRRSKLDKDIVGRKIKNVVTLCNHLVRNTPRQRSLEILSAAGCILDGRPIKLCKDMDVLLMNALGSKIKKDQERTELISNENEPTHLEEKQVPSEELGNIEEELLNDNNNISSNVDIYKNSSNKAINKTDRKVSFLIPDDKNTGESSGDESQEGLSCGHKIEKLPPYLSDSGQTLKAQKCTKCIRTELSGLNIISQLSDETEPYTNEITKQALVSKSVKLFAAKGFRKKNPNSPITISSYHSPGISTEPDTCEEVHEIATSSVKPLQSDENISDFIIDEPNKEPSSRQDDPTNLITRILEPLTSKEIVLTNVANSNPDENPDDPLSVQSCSKSDSLQITQEGNEFKEQDILDTIQREVVEKKQKSVLGEDANNKQFNDIFEFSEQQIEKDLPNNINKSVNQNDRTRTGPETQISTQVKGQCKCDEDSSTIPSHTSASKPEFSNINSQVNGIDEILLRNTTDSFDELNPDFSLWSSEVAFGLPPDKEKEYQSAVDFDSILSASNLEEALKMFEEDIQRAQEESRSTTNAEEPELEVAEPQAAVVQNESPVNAQQEGERARSDSDYVSMEDNRSSQEHTPENQQNQENPLVDVNGWMQDTSHMGPAEREIWGVLDDEEWGNSEPNRFYPRVLTPGTPNLECITEETEDNIPNAAEILDIPAVAYQRPVSRSEHRRETIIRFNSEDETCNFNAGTLCGKDVEIGDQERVEILSAEGGTKYQSEIVSLHLERGCLQININKVVESNILEDESRFTGGTALDSTIPVAKLLDFVKDLSPDSTVNGPATTDEGVQCLEAQVQLCQDDCNSKVGELKDYVINHYWSSDSDQRTCSNQTLACSDNYLINACSEGVSNDPDNQLLNEVLISDSQCAENFSESPSFMSAVTSEEDTETKGTHIQECILHNNQNSKDSNQISNLAINLNVPIIIVEDMDFLDSDDDIELVNCDIAPEVIEEKFNALAGLAGGEYDVCMNEETPETQVSVQSAGSAVNEHFHSTQSTGLQTEDMNNKTETVSDIKTSEYDHSATDCEDDLIQSDSESHNAPVKMHVTHWKQYWDGKTADQKRKEDGKSSGPQKTIKKFTSQYLKCCNTSNWQPRKRRSPSIRIPGIVDKWRKTFEDSISPNNEDSEQPVVNANRIAKQWNKFFENGSRVITPTECSSDVQQEAAVSSNMPCDESILAKQLLEDTKSEQIENLETLQKVDSLYVAPLKDIKFGEVLVTKKADFTLQQFSPMPVITNNNVSQRKISFEKEALEGKKSTNTVKAIPLNTSNHVAKCRLFWDSISKEDQTGNNTTRIVTPLQGKKEPHRSVIIHAENQFTSEKDIIRSSAEPIFGSEGRQVDEEDGLYRARMVPISSDGELSSGVTTPCGQEVLYTHEESPREEAIRSASEEITERAEERRSYGRKDIRKPENLDTRARFQSARMFFQILERSTCSAPKPRAGPFSYASSTDFDDTESECGEKGERRHRRKRRPKVFSEPTSDTETLSRLSGLRRWPDGTLVGGSERLSRRKVSERFHVKDLFKDVAGGGIPHREAVLAALRSVDNSRPTSPYEDQEEPLVSPGPKVYHTEYPHLPTTPPCLFRPRDMLQHGTFITRRDLVNMQ